MSICRACEGNFRIADDHLIDVTTRKTYDPDSKWVLRGKFIIIGLVGNMLLFPLGLIYRTIDLLSLNFVTRGTRAAEHKFLVELKTNTSLKGKAVSSKDIRNECLKELAISVTKIALLPIGFLAKELLCLFGLFFPYQGRKYFGKVNEFFYVRPLDIFRIESDLIAFSNISTPCMQTSQFQREENLFRFHYFARDIGSYHLELETLIDHGNTFYPHDLSDLHRLNWRFNPHLERIKAGIDALKEVLAAYAKTHEADPEDVQKIIDVLTRT